ncbi:MAG: hypothetical protein WD733_14085 [Bryobacterales bacterium]
MNRFGRWWFLNPLEWLKSAYEVFGAGHPRLSLAIAMVVGALLFGALWEIAAHQHKLASQPVSESTGNNAIEAGETVTGPATTHGDSSPANTGTIGSIRIEKPLPVSPKEQETPPEPDEK